MTKPPQHRNRPHEIDGNPKVTRAEARLLSAWRSLRDVNAWQHPTVSELAHVLGRAPQTVHEHIVSLVRKGIIVRIHPNRRYGRCYALTPEAAARPHLGALSRMATRIVKLRPTSMPPCAVHGDAHDDGCAQCVAREEYAALWSEARAIIAEVVAHARTMSKESVASIAREEERRASLVAE